MAKNWIQGAIKNPGSLNAASKAAGMSKSQFCSGDSISTKNKRRCALWKTLNKVRPSKKYGGSVYGWEIE